MAESATREIDPEGFEKNLQECSAHLQEILAYLCSTAENAGLGVIRRRYRHPEPNSGWGISYYTANNRFCEFHPKRNADRVWGFIQGADCEAITAEGFQPSAQEGWFQVRTMPEAVRLVKWIVWAHDRRQ